MDINCYLDSLRKSENVIPDAFYKSIFGQSSIVTTIPPNTHLQLYGNADKMITKKDGTVIYVEEKVREKDYGDFLIEILSNVELKTPGWIEKDNCVSEYLIYFIKPTKIAYVMKFKDIQSEWRKHKSLWTLLFPTKTTLTQTEYGNIYHVKNIAIPFYAISSPIMKIQSYEKIKRNQTFTHRPMETRTN
jgi:hypothetical protein